MKTYSASRVALAAVLALTLASPLVASAEELEIKGMISAREGSQITVTQPGGEHTVVNLTGHTEVVSSSGALGLQKSDRSIDELITGLPVDIDAVQNGSEIDASKVTFKNSDLKTARQVEAGTAQAKERARAKAQELQAQNDELKRRMAEANQYVEKAQTTVLFPVGSATISSESKADLQNLATQARSIKGYLVSVVGYADPTGNPEANQKLSERRAAAVIAYLQKYCGLQPQRVLAGDAMGDAHQVGDVSTAAGRAQNRRVVVKVLTNKGLEGL